MLRWLWLCHHRRGRFSRSAVVSLCVSLPEVRLSDLLTYRWVEMSLTGHLHLSFFSYRWRFITSKSHCYFLDLIIRYCIVSYPKKVKCWTLELRTPHLHKVEAITASSQALRR